MDMSVLGRWTVRSLRVAALTAGLVAGSSSAFAQYPSAPASSPAATKKFFTKNTTFNLPIKMEERVRTTLREVQLYVKSGSGDWVRQEVVSPNTPHFTYRVPSDGEYWFALITVDKSGKATSDINNVTPALRVVVDTRPPVLEAAIAVEGNDPVLRVNIIDANPDMSSISAAVVTEQGDRALSPIAGQPTAFRLSANDLNTPIRVSVSDMSGNMASKDVLGRDLLPAFSHTNSAPATLPPMPSTPQFVGGSPSFTPPANPTFMPPPNNGAGSVNTVAYRTDPGDRPTNRKIINTTHASIDYQIDRVGSSGIGRVEIYLTPDKGQTWTKIGEDVDKRSPAEVDLPGEGLFGIRLAITNGNGFGGKAPRTGDRPSFFIEVDATSPFVQMLPHEMVPAAGAVDIRWTAKDNNLGTEPVSLYFATRPGQWQPIARNVKNDGVYRWTFPRDIGGQFYLKLEVADLAGNVTKVEPPPILLDMTEPEATLVDVNGIPQTNGQSPLSSGGIPSGNIPGMMPGGLPAAPTLPPTLPPR